jgi:hypothetical protein
MLMAGVRNNSGNMGMCNLRYQSNCLQAYTREISVSIDLIDFNLLIGYGDVVGVASGARANDNACPSAAVSTGFANTCRTPTARLCARSMLSATPV